MIKLNFYPKVSIVTPSYNQGEFIEETICSVISQEYPNIEYIIIDGGSSDNTVDIIKKFENYISFWVSEKDFGQAHALNIGFERANGDIYCYLNSDDILVPNAIENVVDTYRETLNKNKFWAAFSVSCFDEKGEITVVRPKTNNWLSDWIDYKAYLHQPGVFWSQSVHKNVGGFDQELDFAFDRKFFMIAILKGYRISTYPEFITTRFRLHDKSKTESIGKVNDLGFAPEFIKISEAIEKSANLLTRARLLAGRHISHDRYGAIELIQEIDDVYKKQNIRNLFRLFKTMKIDNTILFSRFFWGALRKLLKEGG